MEVRVRRQDAGRFRTGQRNRLYPLNRRLIPQDLEKRKISRLCWESSHDSSVIQPTAKSLYRLHCNLLSPAVNPKREAMYRIYRTIRRTFFPKKCDLNSTCVLCAEGKYYFQNYKYPYPHRVKTTVNMILVAVTMIFWVSMINKLYYSC